MTERKSLNNKFYSDRQEKMIANYLGWRQVAGSGARPFVPGDVGAYDWLGECKTHDIEKANIAFQIKHWNKISDEAMGKHRYPVLFTDNGTQRAENTWVMILFSMFDPDQINVIEGLTNTSTKGSSITFKLAEANSLYQKHVGEERLSVFKFSCNGRNVAILPLSTFRDFIEENF